MVVCWTRWAYGLTHQGSAVALNHWLPRNVTNHLPLALLSLASKDPCVGLENPLVNGMALKRSIMEM